MAGGMAIASVMVVNHHQIGFEHSPHDAAFLASLLHALPEATVTVLMESTHQDEVRRLLSANQASRLRFVTVMPIDRRLGFGAQYLRELAFWWRLRRQARAVDRVICLNTRAPLLYAGLLLRLLGCWPRSFLSVLHSPLSQLGKWRSRDPLKRLAAFETALRVAGGIGQFIVLESPIRDELVRLMPALAPRVHVLPHGMIPESASDMPSSHDSGVRFGFLGLGNQGKGIDVFLQAAQEVKFRHGARAAFELIGRIEGDGAPPPGLLDFGPVHAPMPRVDFMRRVNGLDYVCLPFQGGHYRLTASGTLLDAIAAAKPIIAIETPTIAAVFKQFGDLGYCCGDAESFRRTLEAIIVNPDPARYRRQVEAMGRLRDSRKPEALAVHLQALLRAI